MEQSPLISRQLINKFNNMTVIGYDDNFLFGNIFQAS